MIETRYITYLRVSLSVLVGLYEKHYLKDDVIIEVTLPEKDR